MATLITLTNTDDTSTVLNADNILYVSDEEVYGAARLVLVNGEQLYVQETPAEVAAAAGA